jgi:phosphoglycolate phosphatase
LTRLLVFDLDGTLIDSKLDLIHSVNATRAFMRLGPLSNDVVASYVGNGAPVLIRRALNPDAAEADVQSALEYFLGYYRDHMLDNTRLYPTVLEGIERLYAGGAKLAVLTNKPVRFSQALIHGLGLGDRFFRVYGGNSFDQKKPNPIGIEKLLEESGVARERAMMVGDSAVDVRTARNAGIQACGVRYGFQPETFAQDPPDILVDDLNQLADYVLNSASE